MRGKAHDKLMDWPTVRITPAHAGKRIYGQLGAYDGEDHPRPCGEKMPAQSKTRGALGSPPPMRGKELAKLLLRHLTGITPAHAGKSAPASRPIAGTGDHPRPCGEKGLISCA